MWIAKLAKVAKDWPRRAHDEARGILALVCSKG